MGIANRTKEISEQRISLPFTFGSAALTTGETGVLSYVPFNCVLQGAQVAAFSVEADPNLLLTVSQFIPGTGVTTFSIGTTFAAIDFGISGIATAGLSLPIAGNTLLNLMANDVLGYVVGGGSTAGIFGLAGCFVVKPSQDIKVYLGIL